MSKKKNTLKDLDDFLKQQAATLAPPNKLSEKVDKGKRASTPPKPVPAEAPAPTDTPAADEKQDSNLYEEILDNLKTLSEQEGHDFRKKVYDLIIYSAELSAASEPEDKMLINTALYLKSGSTWKDAIQAYWKQK